MRAAVALLLVASAMVLPLPIAARVALAAVLFAVASFAFRPRVREQPAAGWISSDAKGLARLDITGTTRLADWSTRFGVTLLANERRTRGLIAFTTLEQTRYVRVRASDAEIAAAAELFARAAVASDDMLSSARGEEDVALGVTDALRLVHALRARAAESLGRILLSDSRGAPVVLDGDELRIGDRVIDLRAPVEWRPFMFFESAGHMSTVVQATWVRQAGVEAVLVAPMPADGAGMRRAARADADGAPRTNARDARLAQSSPDQPPPHELRTAIERLFMVPLRHALDRAPRASRASSTEPASRERREGHAS